MQKKYKKPSINDVAKLAQVGKASVSRYLNGKLDILSTDIQEKIKSAIIELNYQPSLMARGIKKGNSKLIALIVADITKDYSIEVMHGIENACRQHGYTLLIFNVNNDAHIENDILSILIGYQVEGVIIHSTHSNYDDFKNFPFPIVFLDRKINNLKADIVGLDNDKAIKDIMSHLCINGFEQFLFITEPISNVKSREGRAASFLNEIKMNAKLIGEIFEFTQKNQIENKLYDFMNKIPDKNKAIVTGNSLVTLLVVQALGNINIAYGKDVGLIGIDAPQWTEIAGKGISVLKQPTFDIGQTAFHLLYQRIHNHSLCAKEIYYSGELIIRQSTSYLQGK